MASRTSSYTYTPLDITQRQIRLLHLLPPPVETKGLFGYLQDRLLKPKSGPAALDVSAVRCTFSLASLDDLPEFEALSYVWGHPTSDAAVELEGHLMPVTSNLHATLTHLRHTDRERILWVDALCINQSDNNERSSQVSLMQRIYTQASAVVIFLSKAWDGVDALFKMIEVASANPRLHYDPEVGPSLASFGIDAMSSQMHAALLEFLRLPWWTRVWTVQEYALARRRVLQCGRITVEGATWTDFSHSLKEHAGCCLSATYFKGTEYGVPNVGSGLARASNFDLMLASEERKKHSLLYVASLFKSQQCLHPSDKVYGVLGLASDHSLARIRPDYNRSPGAVYIDVAMAAYATTQSLDFLSFVFGHRYIRRPEVENFTVPSFIPDMTAIVVSQWWATTTLARCTTLECYNATPNSYADFALSHANEASTSAIIIDSIASIGPAFENTSIQGVIDRCRDLARLDEVWGPYESRTQAFMQTLCGGPRSIPSTPWDPTDDEIARSFDAWYSALNSSPSPTTTATTTIVVAAAAAAARFNDAFRTTRAGRRFALSEKGYMCFVPTRSRPNDAIVLMPGGRVPYVLRAADGAYEASLCGTVVRRYAFVGDAYVQGVMHGEAWDVGKTEGIVLV